MEASWPPRRLLWDPGDRTSNNETERYAVLRYGTWGRYHGGQRPSSDDSFHGPTVIPPSALDKPSNVKSYHRRRSCIHTSPRRSPTMVTLHDTRFDECRWWNDGWTVKTVVTWRSSASMIPAPGQVTPLWPESSTVVWETCSVLITSS